MFIHRSCTRIHDTSTYKVIIKYYKKSGMLRITKLNAIQLCVTNVSIVSHPDSRYLDTIMGHISMLKFSLFIK